MYMYLENSWGYIAIAPKEVDKLRGVGSQASLTLNSWQLTKGMQESASQCFTLTFNVSLFLSLFLLLPLPLPSSL